MERISALFATHTFLLPKRFIGILWRQGGEVTRITVLHSVGIEGRDVSEPHGQGCVASRHKVQLFAEIVSPRELLPDGTPGMPSEAFQVAAVRGNGLIIAAALRD